MHVRFQNSCEKDINTKKGQKCKKKTKKNSNLQIRYAKKVENNISKKMQKKQKYKKKRCKKKGIWSVYPPTHIYRFCMVLEKGNIK